MELVSLDLIQDLPLRKIFSLTYRTSELVNSFTMLRLNCSTDFWPSINFIDINLIENNLNESNKKILSILETFKTYLVKEYKSSCSRNETECNLKSNGWMLNSSIFYKNLLNLSSEYENMFEVQIKWNCIALSCKQKILFILLIKNN